MTKYKKWIQPVLCLSLFIFIINSLISSINNGVYIDDLKDEPFVRLNEKWTSKDIDDKHIRYTYHVDDDFSLSDVLYLKLYWSDFKVLLNNEQIYEYNSDLAIWPRHTHLISLNNDLKNGTIEILINNESKNIDLMINAYLGSQYQILIEIIRSNAFAVALFISSVVCAVIIISLTIYFKRFIDFKIFWGLVNLCIMFVLTGIWLFFDSEIALLMTTNIKFISYITLFSFMLIPVFLVNFVDMLLEGKYKEFSLISICYLINLFCCFFNSGIFSLESPMLLISQHILLIISIIDVWIRTFIETRKYKKNEVVSFMFGFTSLAVCVLLALLVFWLSPVTKYSYIYGIGILIFFCALAYSVFHRLYATVNESFKADIYRELAYLDIMTNLPNRTCFVSDCQKKDIKTFILFDLNNLKFINDSKGHQAGDRLIIDAANCIKNTFSGFGNCYRFGGDEFVVILDTYDKKIIEEIIIKFKKSVEIFNSNTDQPLDIAVGYAIKDNEESIRELFNRADKNMYEVKREMKNNI